MSLLTTCSSQASRLQRDVDHISAMLGDIHEWYLRNLMESPEDTTLGAASALSPGTASAVPDTGAQTLVLELHQQSGPKSTLVCPRASLSPKISGAYYSSSLKHNQLFTCNCASGDGSHRSAVGAYGCESPLPNTCARSRLDSVRS